VDDRGRRWFDHDPLAHNWGASAALWHDSPINDRALIWRELPRATRIPGDHRLRLHSGGRQAQRQSDQRVAKRPGHQRLLFRYHYMSITSTTRMFVGSTSTILLSTTVYFT